MNTQLFENDRISVRLFAVRPRATVTLWIPGG